MFNDLSFCFSLIVVNIYVLNDDFIFINTMFFVRFRACKKQNLIVNCISTENIADTCKNSALHHRFKFTDNHLRS